MCTPPLPRQVILERNLGKPVGEVFQEFQQVPIAAASLGQVHIAKLGGEKVVVKVQRPGLKDLFDIDLKNIRAIAVWLQKVGGWVGGWPGANTRRGWLLSLGVCVWGGHGWLAAG